MVTVPASSRPPSAHCRNRPSSKTTLSRGEAWPGSGEPPGAPALVQSSCANTKAAKSTSRVSSSSGAVHVPSVEDGIRLKSTVQAGANKAIAIVGGGFIGLEMAEELTNSGLQVHLFEVMPRLLPFLEERFSAAVLDVLQRHGVQVHLGAVRGFVDVHAIGHPLQVVSVGQAVVGHEVEYLLERVERAVQHALIALDNVDIRSGDTGALPPAALR